MSDRLITSARVVGAGLLLLLAVSAPVLAAPDDPAPDPKEAAAERRRQSERLFESRDTNRDNVLKGEELPKDWDAWFDLDGDDEVSRKEFLEIRTHPVLKVGHPLRHAGPRARKALRDFDRDKNGTVAAEEYPGAPHVFRGADRNRDGQLDLKELLRLAKDELDGIERRLKSPSLYDLRELFDLNGDGQVTELEYDGPKRAFGKADSDGDGTLSYAELYPERMMREDREAAPPGDRTVIDSMDADLDGRVSREEWKGTESAWKRLDRNRDGYITSGDAR